MLDVNEVRLGEHDGPLDPLLEPEGVAQVGPEPGLDGGDREPVPVRAAVDAVARVAAGQHSVAGGGHRAHSQVLVDRQRHQGQHQENAFDAVEALR